MHDKMHSHSVGGFVGRVTMTLALPQPVPQANSPRSRACQRECQSVRGRLVTARGCLKLKLAA
jgi:hypothetical protein